jgi:antitoxin MazE
MHATIQKWGNSQAVRIPKGILEVAALHENDRVQISAESEQIVIRKISRKHRTIKERLDGYEGDYKPAEWDTGETLGKEVW